MFLKLKEIPFDKKDNQYIAILSVIFSFFMIFGKSFYLTNSWDLVVGSISAIIRSVIMATAYFGIFFTVLHGLWAILVYPDKFYQAIPLMCKHSNKEKKVPILLRYFDDHPFLISFIFLVMIYLPHVIAFYPGIFMGDTPDLIAQGFNLPEYTSTYLNLLDEAVRLNQHHPVAHTVLLHVFLVIGHSVFHSWNFGLFMYSLFQTLLLTCGFSICIAKLTAWGVNRKMRIAVLLYFAFSPRIQNYLMLVTKDPIYTVFLLFFLLSFFTLLKNDEKNEQISSRENLKNNIVFLSSILGMILFRNDSKYILLLVFGSIFIAVKKYRKKCAIIILAILIFTSLYAGILSAMKISPGSRREILSIPFQQTARYLRDVPDYEITDEERAAIDAILDYESIKQEYNPDRSDVVKATFNESATTKELLEYFKAWFQMFLKHPGIYIQATMNNVYDYFYPGGLVSYRYSEKQSMKIMETMNEYYSEADFDFHYNNKTHSLRSMIEMIEIIFYLPIFSVFIIPATYTWSVFILFAADMKQRKNAETIILLPILFTILMCIAGPCNGWYFRYIFPIAGCLPFLIAIQFARQNSSIAIHHITNRRF